MQPPKKTMKTYETTSTFSQTLFQENQHQNPHFSDQNHETRPGFFKKQGSWPKSNIKRRKNQVFLEGYVDDDELVRAKSLTDEDLEELKGCLDLGFGFSYDEIPELCNTLPALELCYSMSQKFLDDQQKSPESPSPSPSPSPSHAVVDEVLSPPPIANWKISSPGDHPEDVKARLKYWAQAVACTVRLCN